MPLDDVKSHDRDARLRKRERDKENQRQKRLREKQFVAQLQQRIELLEGELQASQSGDRIPNPSSLDVVTRLRARNEFLENRLQQIRALVSVDEFGHNGQAPTPGLTPRRQHSNVVVDVNGSENGTPDSATKTPVFTSHPQQKRNKAGGSSSGGVDAHMMRAGSHESLTQPHFDNIPQPGPVTVDCMFRHFGESYTSVPSSAPSILPPGNSCPAPEAFLDREPVGTPIIFSGLHHGVEFPWNPATPKHDMDPMVPLNNLDQVLSVPDYRRLPRCGPIARLRLDPFASVTEKLQRNPEVFATYDVIPKPIDLLFGGSSNQLTNLIMETMGGGPALQPEKFAIGWHCYIYTRWRIEQTQENYLRIPPTLRPTLMQYLVPHHPNLDVILWPEVRENFIKYESKYCQDEVFGLLACCVRIRWGFNRKFIVRHDGGDPELDPLFADKMLDLDSWGILERFWEVYPELVVGLDREKCLIKESHLIP